MFLCYGWHKKLLYLSFLQDIPESITTDINIGGDAEGELTDLTTSVDNLDNTEVSIPVDPSSITGLDSDTQQTSSDLSSLGSAAEDASKDIVDAMGDADAAINTLGSDAENTAGDIEDTGSAAGDTASNSGGGSGNGCTTASSSGGSSTTSTARCTTTCCMSC